MNKLLLSLLLLLVALLLLGKSSIYRFLALTERVDTDVLVVEGWTNQEGVEQAAAEADIFGYQRVIVASLAYPFDSTAPLLVPMEGGLTFNLTGLDTPLSPVDSVTVVAGSEDLQEIPAHFRLWVNDSVVGERYAQASLAAYGFRLANPTPAEKITIEFDNDEFVTGVGDRNLVVQSVTVGNRTLYARMPYVRYDRGAIDGNGLYRTDQRSEADETAERLHRAGVPEEMLTTVAAPPTDYDRTYATAVAVRDWLAQQPEGLPAALNVLSESAHARRSRLLYQKAFGDAVLIGVIAAPREDVSADTWWKTPSARAFTFAQIAKYLYARLLFWPESPAPLR